MIQPFTSPPTCTAALGGAPVGCHVSGREVIRLCMACPEGFARDFFQSSVALHQCVRGRPFQMVLETSQNVLFFSEAHYTRSCKQHVNPQPHQHRDLQWAKCLQKEPRGQGARGAFVARRDPERQDASRHGNSALLTAAWPKLKVRLSVLRGLESC